MARTITAPPIRVHLPFEDAFDDVSDDVAARVDTAISAGAPVEELFSGEGVTEPSAAGGSAEPAAGEGAVSTTVVAGSPAMLVADWTDAGGRPGRAGTVGAEVVFPEGAPPADGGAGFVFGVVFDDPEPPGGATVVVGDDGVSQTAIGGTRGA